MPTSHTRLTIYNLALDLIAEYPLQPGSTTPYANWLNRRYEHTVEVALRSNLWNFAREFHVLQPDGTYEASRRWTTRYSWPNGALRLVPPRYLGLRTGQTVPHEAFGDHVYTNTTGELRTDWIMRRLEPGTWDPLFAEVIICSLAMGMAHRFVQKNSFLKTAKQLKDEAYEQAEMVNAFEGTAETNDDYDIIFARE